MESEGSLTISVSLVSFTASIILTVYTQQPGQLLHSQWLKQNEVVSSSSGESKAIVYSQVPQGISCLSSQVLNNPNNNLVGSVFEVSLYLIVLQKSNFTTGFFKQVVSIVMHPKDLGAKKSLVLPIEVPVPCSH